MAGKKKDLKVIKLIYLNLMYFIVFIIAVSLVYVGFTTEVSQKHMIILETFGLPMLTACLTFWALEARHFLKERSKND